MEVKKNKERGQVTMSEERLKESQDPLQEEKNKLRKQIKALRSINSELECNLDLYSFGNIKFESIINNSDIIVDPSKIPNVNVELETEIFRFGGFSTLELSPKDCIFNLSSFNKYDKKQEYGIQVVYGNNKWSLGKWCMPFDLEDTVHRFSSQIKDIPNFIRSCKHYLDCYSIRREQFNMLKETMSDTKKIKLHKNVGYTHIILNLIDVYSVTYDSYINTNIYIHYDVNEVRPHKVDIELEDEKELNKEEKGKFKTFVKWLKLLDLNTAFEQMLNERLLAWSNEAVEENLPETYDSDDSDGEDFLKTILHKSKRSDSLQTRQNRKKRDDLSTSENVKKDKKSGVSKKKKTDIQQPSQHSTSLNKSNKIVTSTSPEQKFEHKRLKQTKLNFQLNKDSLMKPSTSSKLLTPETSMTNEKIDKVITSTPMHQNGSIRMETDALDNISVISNKD
ncbi:uncharacterized protein LOC144470512 [Augochlora pura]